MHKCLDPQKASKKVGLMQSQPPFHPHLSTSRQPQNRPLCGSCNNLNFFLWQKKLKSATPQPSTRLPNWACSRLLNSFSQPLRAGTSKKAGAEVPVAKSPSSPGAVDLSQHLLHQLLLRILQMIRMRLALVVQIIQIHGWIVLTHMDL